MRKQLPAVAAGALLALVAVLAVLWVAGDPASSGQRVDSLAAELRCPDCQGLAVADSQTASAREIRRQIAELVDAGASDAEVRARFVDRYGEWILLAPTSPAAWILPIVAFVVGVAALAMWLVRRQPGTSPAPSGIDDETRRRLRDEVEALDA